MLYASWTKEVNHASILYEMPDQEGDERYQGYYDEEWQTGSTMQQVGVSCADCHMPMATKSAQALGPYQGDVMTHLFRINTDPDVSMFSEDGGQALGYLTLDFACLSCHQDKDIQWAGDNAEDIHSQGK